MSFGDNFLKGFFGTDYLKDYTHASKTFRSNGYELAPRYKFLYHCRFNLNTVGIKQLGTLFDPGDIDNLSVLVKSVKLPSYTFDTETLNQYNRKRLVQKKIDYQPIDIVFHDDGSDLVRNLWYNYFSYFYKDPSYQYDNPAVTNAQTPSGNGNNLRGDYNTRDTYNHERLRNDWGYIGESYTDGSGNTIPAGGKPRFFNDITIYGMNQHKWASYVLINPMIVSWDHDTYDYSEGNGLMTHRVSIAYETVKYYSGQMSGQNPDTFVKGFASPTTYDTVDSPLSRPGSTTSIFGQGGVLDAIGTIGNPDGTGSSGLVGAISDLANGRGNAASVLGAVQDAGTIYEAFKDKNLRSIVEEEGNVILDDVLRNGLPGQTQIQQNSSDAFVFNKQPGTGDATANQKATLKSADATINDGPNRVQT